MIKRKLFFTTRQVTRPLPEAYQPDSKGRFVWLQRLAQRVLKRWGQHVIVEDRAVEEYTLPTAEGILNQIQDELRARLCFSAFRLEDLVIIVGPAAHYQIYLAYADMWRFYEGSGLSMPPEAFGVPIYVTSWIDGWIVLPRNALHLPPWRTSGASRSSKPTAAISAGPRSPPRR